MTTKTSAKSNDIREAVLHGVKRFDQASLEDIRPYVKMRLGSIDDRTVLRYLKNLTTEGVLQRSGTRAHYLYCLAPKS
jgi:Fic family protein